MLYGENSNLVTSLKLDAQFISQNSGWLQRPAVRSQETQTEKTRKMPNILRLFKRILKVFEILLIITMDNVY